MSNKLTMCNNIHFPEPATFFIAKKPKTGTETVMLFEG